MTINFRPVRLGTELPVMNTDRRCVALHYLTNNLFNKSAVGAVIVNCDAVIHVRTIIPVSLIE